MSTTAPAVAVHFVFVTQHPRAHRIEMHIVAYLPQIRASTPVHQKRFVAAAKKMAAKAVSPVELLSVGTQEPLHACAQIRTGRLYHHMKMIAHQTISMNLPSASPAAPRHELKEKLSIAVTLKDGFASVAPTQQMINRPRIFDSQGSSHRPKE